MYAQYRLACFIIMRASFQGVVFSEQGRHLDSCNTEQLDLRLCFLNGIKLKKNITWCQNRDQPSRMEIGKFTRTLETLPTTCGINVQWSARCKEF